MSSLFSQEMLGFFGIPFIDAPQEAEAECASLLTRSLVDGIVTDDSDVFLFGGSRIYRNMFNDGKYVECYLLADLEREIGLDRDKLVRLAYLLGSDYTEGLPGVGPVLGMELLDEFPGDGGLKRFKEWWSGVQKGREDIESLTGWRRKFVRFLLLLPSLPSRLVRRRCDSDDNLPSPTCRKRATRSSFSICAGRTHKWCVARSLLPPLLQLSRDDRLIHQSVDAYVQSDAYYRPTVQESDENFVWGTVDLDGLRKYVYLLSFPFSPTFSLLTFFSPSLSYLARTLGWDQPKSDSLLLPLITRENDRKSGKLKGQKQVTDLRVSFPPFSLCTEQN